MPCTVGHTPASLDSAAPRRDGLEVVFVKDDPSCRKACHYTREGSTIRVNPEWWAKLSNPQRAFCLAHESAHVEGVICEHCADLRAGSILRRWGFSKRSAVNAGRAIVHTRPSVGNDAAAGWGS